MTRPATTSWSLAAPPADYVLGHVRAVLPDRVLDDARLVVRDGAIAEVAEHPSGSSCDVDGAGLLCLPGIVDVHSDGLEKEVMPRPGAPVPWEFALLSFEGKLRSAGVTTVFHGAAFEAGVPIGLSRNGVRSVETAHTMCEMVAARGAGPVDHRILHRLDVRSPEGLAALQERLAGFTGTRALVSHEDHTPGIGQYADRAYYERFVAGTRGLSEEQAREHVDRLTAERDGRLDVRDESLRWLGEVAAEGRIRLLGHDPASKAEIDDLIERGGTVAEFPTTLEAATAARERGLPVVAGAPNVLRGASHSGNVSAAELASRGLLTALASDYLPSGLVAAAFLLAGNGVLLLPAAVALVTSGGAEVAGLDDRGALVPGARADVVLVEPGRPWPVVAATLRAGH
ncbi:alpha-D-ribose 1-methylphosphonate 5-triphosphate diphosphatase [Pseudonocardia sp. TRM90224]|uniref:alpha-D-ribose 1-methylphosphonate 5-triphosphate diphosphatase n=1 Tax=Pseudonocardia sp. TRM90224 TaxID=2812678 RepID=UPI001E5252A5|nr:alpha-D-ribose 1-methylphosphonate 5-triphosphate diphosphatase [Pseudonocardia sp. TRM90224]